MFTAVVDANEHGLLLPIVGFKAYCLLKEDYCTCKLISLSSKDAFNGLGCEIGKQSKYNVLA